MFGRDCKSVAGRLIDAISSEDLASVERVLDDDVVYIDSVGDRIEGKAACMAAMRHMFSLDLQFRIKVESLAKVGTHVLVRGRCNSRDPSLNARCLWRIFVRNGKIAEYQSHRSDSPPSFARRLSRGVEGDFARA